jgi:hypothetical protein
MSLMSRKRTKDLRVNHCPGIKRPRFRHAGAERRSLATAAPPRIRGAGPSQPVTAAESALGANS